MARKKANIHYLYKTTCLVTGRYYIGMHSTSNLEDGYMGSGKRLRYSIRKYGIDNHKKEILEFFDTRDLLIEAEKIAITSEMLIDKDCMNLKHGGEGGFISEEQQRHRSKCGGEANAKRLKTDIEYRKSHIKIHSDLFKKLHAAGKITRGDWSGKKHKEETKQLMSDKAKQRVGKANSQYGTCWITREGLNKKIKKEDLEIYLSEGWVKGRK
jgi:hypothetical protein